MSSSDDDWSFLFRALGCLPTTLGGALVLAGAGYAFAEWRYAGVVLLWSLMWGLMFVGVGCAVMATGRRWMSALAVVACAISAGLVYTWELEQSLEPWPLWLYPADALGIMVACVSLVRSFRRVS
jgi:hypothetical protein